MNESDLLIILDRAHGVNVSGKCSPNGKHQEWLWSDKFVNDLSAMLDQLRVHNIVHPKTPEVPLYKTKSGVWKEKLSNRVAYYNSLQYKYKLVLSFHNDSTGNGWTKQTGWSMWTTRRNDISDDLAENYLHPVMIDYFPNLRHRRYIADQLDNEANFKVLTGNYASILIEWLMQNNKKDIELLKDSSELREAMVQFIMKVHLDFHKLKKDWIK